MTTNKTLGHMPAKTKHFLAFCLQTELQAFG